MEIVLSCNIAILFGHRPSVRRANTVSQLVILDFDLFMHHRHQQDRTNGGDVIKGFLTLRQLLLCLSHTASGAAQLVS